jgi:tetratricopeptide (TPR) repeat protein
VRRQSVSKTSLIRAVRVFSVVAAAAVVLASAPARAQSVDQDRKARTYFAAGRYQQALDIYAELYAQTLHPTYLRNIGRCYQNMNEPGKAVSSFREYLRKAQKLDAKSRAEVEGYIKELEEQERARKAAPPPASSTPPPSPPPAASPPAASAPPPAAPPKLDAPMPKSDDASATLVRADASAPASASQDDRSSPVYTQWWFWTGIGAVVAGGVVAAILLSSNPQAPDAQTTLGTMQPKR